MSASEPRLRITEIFYSLQGESSAVGWPTVFVRLTGCPLRCQYCDTEYAFSGGQWYTVSEIIEQVKQHACHHVCVTGGEPLAQKHCLKLLNQLSDEGYKVSLETSGAMDISMVDSRVVRVVDLKTPASGEMEKNLYSNIDHLNQHDEVKFVICDQHDYEWAKQMVEQYKLPDCCQVLFSPVHGDMAPATLADWILHDQLNVRFQVQLHKSLWGEQPGK